jgi:hypothetical protein
MSSRPAAVFIACALTIAACAQGQVGTTRVDRGETSVEAARARLQGRWTLVSLTVSSLDGRKSGVDATGVLNFDAFGNLQIEYRLTDAAQDTLEGLGIERPGPSLSTSGNVAINPVSQEIVYVGAEATSRALSFDPKLAARRANPFALERVRYYQFVADDELVLATRHENGTDAAVARWKRGA